MRYAAIIIVLPFLFVLSLSPDVNALPAQQIVLDGVHKISPGDDPAWALPEYNDSQWQSIIAPGSWQSQGFRPVKGMGWYRIHFTAPAGLKDLQPAILLGRIGDADEVFLNGVKIGGEGLIGERFVEATKVHRLYGIPSTLPRYDADNVLAIRVMNTYLNGGIFDKNVMIGNFNDLLTQKLKREKNGIIIEFCFFTFFAMFFLACLFLFIKRLRDREYIYFWIFISLYGVLFVLGSLTFYNAGLKDPFVQQVINIFSTGLPAILIILLAHVYRLKYHVPIKAALLIYLAISLMEPVFPGYGPRTVLLVFWKVLFILTAGYIVFLSINAYLRKFYEAGPILLGVTGLVIGLILESIGGLDLLQTTGFFLWDYSTDLFYDMRNVCPCITIYAHPERTPVFGGKDF